ncbi:MAG: sulfur carrier protein ThiS [Micromonosporaceae bacterium]
MSIVGSEASEARSERGAEQLGTVNVRLNGASQVVTDGTNVADAVSSLTTAARGVAVALNGEVVPRTEWSRTRLSDGDDLEVLTANQGG